MKYRTSGGVQDGLVVGQCSVDILARGRTRAVRRPGAGKGDGGEEVMEEIVAVEVKVKVEEIVVVEVADVEAKARGY